MDGYVLNHLYMNTCDEGEYRLMVATNISHCLINLLSTAELLLHCH